MSFGSTVLCKNIKMKNIPYGFTLCFQKRHWTRPAFLSIYILEQSFPLLTEYCVVQIMLNLFQLFSFTAILQTAETGGKFRSFSFFNFHELCSMNSFWSRKLRPKAQEEIKLVKKKKNCWKSKYNLSLQSSLGNEHSVWMRKPDSAEIYRCWHLSELFSKVITTKSWC